MKFFKKVLIAIYLILFFVFFANLTLAYKSPGNPINYVSDFANVLTLDQETLLNTKLKSFEDQTSNQITVVTINSLDGEDLVVYATKLFEEWKIGQAKKDNGVLLLLVMNDRKSRIEVGYGLEGALTDLLSKSILNNDITPNFRNSKYYEGINIATDHIIDATKGEYKADSSTEDSQKFFNAIGAFLSNFGCFIIFFVPISMSIMAQSRKNYLFGGILGLIIGIIISIALSVGLWSILVIILSIIIGFVLDLILSLIGPQNLARAMRGTGRAFGRSGGFGGGGGGFSGGGGSSGGGGASGSW